MLTSIFFRSGLFFYIPYIDKIIDTSAIIYYNIIRIVLAIYYEEKKGVWDGEYKRTF